MFIETEVRFTAEDGDPLGKSGYHNGEHVMFTDKNGSPVTAAELREIADTLGRLNEAKKQEAVKEQEA